MEPVVSSLRCYGINFILNYAAEEDVSVESPEGAVQATDSAEERARDAATQRFLRDILAADNVGGIPFIAAKVSKWRSQTP